MLGVGGSSLPLELLHCQPANTSRSATESTDVRRRVVVLDVKVKSIHSLIAAVVLLAFVSDVMGQSARAYLHCCRVVSVSTEVFDS